MKDDEPQEESPVEELRRFLAGYPLLKKFWTPSIEVNPSTFNSSRSGARWVPHEMPATVQLDCVKCGETTFLGNGDNRDDYRYQLTGRLSSSPVHRVYTYRCGLCGEKEARFWIAENHDDAGSEWTKIGQYPKWDASPHKETSKALSREAVFYYRQGLACLANSFGVGAVAYFRRAVEESMRELLDMTESLANEENNKELLSKVAEARGQKLADDKLRVVYHCLPASLTVNGNPLRMLYDSYSDGLHSQNEEEATTTAMEMKAVFEFVFTTLRQTLRNARKLRESMESAKTKREATQPEG